MPQRPYPSGGYEESDGYLEYVDDEGVLAEDAEAEDDALPEDPYMTTSYPEEDSDMTATDEGYHLHHPGHPGHAQHAYGSSRRSYAAGRQHSYPGAVPDPNSLQPPGMYRRGFSEDVNEIRNVAAGYEYDEDSYGSHPRSSVPSVPSQRGVADGLSDGHSDTSSVRR